MRPLTTLLLILLTISTPSLAQDIVVLGLFKNKVVLKKDGKRIVLKAGDKTGDGLHVLSANAKQAVIRIGDKEEIYTLGMQIQASFAPPKLAQVSIPRDDYGMYRVKGQINKTPIDFLVDTGATLLAMNANQAAQLNINYTQGEPIMVETASGQANAYKVLLKQVSVGQITLRDVEALVVDGSSPKEVLLGMSFLKHLNMENKHSVMLLKQKF